MKLEQLEDRARIYPTDMSMVVAAADVLKLIAVAKAAQTLMETPHASEAYEASCALRDALADLSA